VGTTHFKYYRVWAYFFKRKGWC